MMKLHWKKEMDFFNRTILILKISNNFLLPEFDEKSLLIIQEIWQRFGCNPHILYNYYYGYRKNFIDLERISYNIHKAKHSSIYSNSKREINLFRIDDMLHEDLEDSDGTYKYGEGFLQSIEYCNECDNNGKKFENYDHELNFIDIEDNKKSILAKLKSSYKIINLDLNIDNSLGITVEDIDKFKKIP